MSSASQEGPGKDCSSGCYLDDDTPLAINESVWLQHLRLWAQQPVGTSTTDLDTLLFYREQSLSLLPSYQQELKAEHLAYLQAQLLYNSASIEMQITDETGRLRGSLASANFTLRKKQHFQFSDTKNLGQVITAGRVQRVGLHHVWSRW